jgi:hypothetical protein
MRTTRLGNIWDKIPVALFCAVLTASITLNLLLAFKYRAATTPHPTGIQVGISLKSIPVAELDGNRRDIKLDANHWTVLYVMAPGCSWCARNLENIRTLASHSASTFRFIGLSNTAKGLDQYLATTPLPFPVKVADIARFPAGLNVTSTPQMALVGPDGRVTRVWVGALGGGSQTEVEQYFNVKLPGWHEEKSAVE